VVDIGFPKLIVFPVLACNQHCRYCVNRYGDYSGTMPSVVQYKPDPASRWISAIRSLSGLQSLNVNGGEPGLHPEIAEIVNAVPDQVEIGLGTNATRAVIDRLLKIDRRDNLWIQATFHATQVSTKEFAECLGLLLEKFRGRMGFHTVGKTAQEDYDYFQKSLGLVPSWHDFMADETGMLASDHPSVKPNRPSSTVLCRMPFWAEVAPDGNLYTCHTLMYARSSIGVLGNIFEGWVVKATEMVCPKYGHCNPCDINRFLDKTSLLTDYLANPRQVR
jgi:hypothetical protein